MPFVRDKTWKDTFKRWASETDTLFASRFATKAGCIFIIVFVMLVSWVFKGCPAGGPW